MVPPMSVNDFVRTLTKAMEIPTLPYTSVRSHPIPLLQMSDFRVADGHLLALQVVTQILIQLLRFPTMELALHNKPPK